jgi:hypothetical protein
LIQKLKFVRKRLSKFNIDTFQSWLDDLGNSSPSIQYIKRDWLLMGIHSGIWIPLISGLFLILSLTVYCSMKVTSFRVWKGLCRFFETYEKKSKPKTTPWCYSFEIPVFSFMSMNKDFMIINVKLSIINWMLEIVELQDGATCFPDQRFQGCKQL